MDATAHLAECLTITQASRLLRVTPKQLRAWCTNRQIPSLLVGARRYVHPRDVEDFILATHAITTITTNAAESKPKPKPNAKSKKRR